MVVVFFTELSLGLATGVRAGLVWAELAADFTEESEFLLLSTSQVASLALFWGKNWLGKLLAREIRVSRTCLHTTGEAWGWIVTVEFPTAPLLECFLPLRTSVR